MAGSAYGIDSHTACLRGPTSETGSLEIVSSSGESGTNRTPSLRDAAVARRRGVRGRTERSSVTPIIRKGANGSFYDKGLEGASHRAVIPNVNTVDDLRLVWVFYSAQI
jgi:hypothetical protein